MKNVVRLFGCQLVCLEAVVPMQPRADLHGHVDKMDTAGLCLADVDLADVDLADVNLADVNLADVGLKTYDML